MVENTEEAERRRLAMLRQIAPPRVLGIDTEKYRRATFLERVMAGCQEFLDNLPSWRDRKSESP